MTQKRTAARRRTRDGLFQRNNWWWVDYYDAEGRRHRKKAAPDYETAKLIYREIRQAIAKGEVLGIREEGLRLRDFVEKRYWPTVEVTVSPYDWTRARGILDRRSSRASAASTLPSCGGKTSSGGDQSGWPQWPGPPPTKS